MQAGQRKGLDLPLLSFRSQHRQSGIPPQVHHCVAASLILVRLAKLNAFKKKNLTNLIGPKILRVFSCGLGQRGLALGADAVSLVERSALVLAHLDLPPRAAL